MCTGNGRTPAPSGATLELPKPPSTDVPTVTLRLDRLLAETRRRDTRPVVRVEG